jgi:predicted nucleic acid-binding protein
MPISGSGPEILVDASAAIAFSVEDHSHHDATFRALMHRRRGLAGHAAFETFSVLTRLPPPARQRPATVARLLATDFPHSRFLGPDAAASLFGELHKRGIGGGAVYDALVGAVAREHDLPLATRDRRALDTYGALGVRVEPLF